MEKIEPSSIEAVMSGRIAWQDLAVCGLRSTVQPTTRTAEQPENLVSPEDRIDPITFYPRAIHGSAKYKLEVEKARTICKGCPVKDFCLRTALNDDHREGIWGGMSEEERADARQALKRRKIVEIDLATASQLRIRYAKPLNNRAIAALQSKLARSSSRKPKKAAANPATATAKKPDEAVRQPQT